MRTIADHNADQGDGPPEAESPGPEVPVDPPQLLIPLPWRAKVARWPIEYRQRWGDRANQLQDEGLGWREAESTAFDELQDEAFAADGWGPKPRDDDRARAFFDDDSLTISPAEVRSSLESHTQGGRRK